MNVNIGALFRRTVQVAILFGLTGTLSAAAAAVFKLNPSASEISFTLSQMNVPVKAAFKKFTGQIGYESTAQGPASADVKITVNSIDMGDAEFNREALKKEWLNAAQFPEASFTLSAAGPGATENGKTEVSGALTIKGKTIPVRFPVNVKTESKRQIFEGNLPISRLAFNVGDGEWKDTSIVKDQVIIHFRLVTEP